MPGEIFGEGAIALLARFADVRGLEALGVQAVHRVGAILEAGHERSEESDAALAPRRRDDLALDLGAKDAVEERRLVHLVDEPHRYQQEAGAHVQRLPEKEVE